MTRKLVKRSEKTTTVKKVSPLRKKAAPVVQEEAQLEFTDLEPMVGELQTFIPDNREKALDRALFMFEGKTTTPEAILNMANAFNQFLSGEWSPPEKASRSRSKPAAEKPVVTTEKELAAKSPRKPRPSEIKKKEEAAAKRAAGTKANLSVVESAKPQASTK